MQVGGIKGHVAERINGNVCKLYGKYRWKPIPLCTGRYTCRDHASVSTLPPEALLFPEDDTVNYQQTVQEFQLPGRNDRLLVLPLDDTNQTGIITYVKKESNDDTTRFVHTLNTPSGFRRKLQAIGIRVDDHKIWIDN